MELDILLANSDETYCKELILSFETEDYNIKAYNTIEGALEALRERDFDLALIDMEFPDGTGLDLKKKMNDIKDIPTIVVTLVSDDIQKVLALEYGADDYLVRPFNILELKARIRAVLRRVTSLKLIEEEFRQKSQSLVCGELEINIVGRTVLRNGEEIDLTGKEFDFLYILALNPGQVYSRKELAEKIWGENYEGHLRTVDVHIRRLREKLENPVTADQYIQTKWGEGYYLRNDEE